jgi:hypothetical protein
MEGGGPIESITIAGRRFPVDGEDAAKITLGGFSNEIKPNGDGTARVIKSRVLASISDLNVQIDPNKDDLEYIQEKRNEHTLFDTSVTLVDGTVYAGATQITDEVEYDSKEGTAGISLTGRLQKQRANEQSEEAV